ncbi:hypothetical protein KI387_023283, partial [Taxus chinensis]
RKRKSTSQIVVPKFDVVAALLGTTPPPPTKREKMTSRIVSDLKGEQFMEIAKPRVDKEEKYLLVFDLELMRIPLGDSMPESEVHNLREIVTRVIE